MWQATKSDDQDDPHVTFLLPFESNWSAINTRLRVALFLVGDIYIRIYPRPLFIRFFTRVMRMLYRLKSFIRAFSYNRGQTDLEAVATNAVTRYFQFGRLYVGRRRVALERTKGPETVDWLFRLSCQSRDTVWQIRPTNLFHNVQQRNGPDTL